jgi:multidrug efflux system outer membrane protein
MAKKMAEKIALCLVGALLLAGCQSLAPDYARPPAPTPADWPQGPAYAAPKSGPAGAAAGMGWREFFAGTKLARLVEMALANNRDLRVALLNIEKARAQYQINRADLLPTLSAAGNANIQRLPADLSTSGDAMVSRQYSVTLGFSSYELDLFGRVQSLKDQALEQFLASE